MLCYQFYRKDHFRIVSSSYLGRIKKITIGHDNSGLNPSWFLNKVWAGKNNTFDNLI
jgi:hypothetical protein